MSDSKYPELYALMYNLYQAGMSIERVLEHGFDMALRYQYERSGEICYTSSINLTATQIVREVAGELGISRAAQAERWTKGIDGLHMPSWREDR